MAPPAELLLGTDCSGMEAPGFALRNLGVNAKHAFACDISSYSKKTIFANFEPQRWYDDLEDRDNSKAPKTDIYVAGFPCQPFSCAGKLQGFGDEKGRGNVFFGCLRYLKAKTPAVFVLENVKGLTTANGGKYFEAVLSKLEELRMYNIYWKVLKTNEHGIPQKRPRVYICGIQKSRDKGTFEFPAPIPCPDIEEFLEPRVRKATAQDRPASGITARRNVGVTLRKLEKAGHKPLSKAWVSDIDSSTDRFSMHEGCSACLTHSRGKGHWITNRGRRMLLSEQLRLQGLPTVEEGFVQAVSDRQLGAQIGNSMSVNVLERVFVRLLPAANLVPAHKLLDRWEARADGRPILKLASKASSSPPRGVKRRPGLEKAGPAKKVRA